MSKYTKIGDEPKFLVPRHRTFSRTSAHRCEKVIETRVRRQSRREIEQQLDSPPRRPPTET